MNRKAYRAFWIKGNLIQCNHYLSVHYWRTDRRDRLITTSGMSRNVEDTTVDRILLVVTNCQLID